MFEKRPIWGIIVGLNVCILIWLISVQEPVMYDASTAIISSNLQQQQVNAAGVVGAGLDAAVLTPPRGGRDDRDVKQQLREQQQQRPQYRGEHLHSNNNDVTSTFTTVNFSNSNSINNSTIYSPASTNLENGSPAAASMVKTTTDAINLSADIHSLTSSLGTGVLDGKVKPTPSWMQLTAVSSALPHEDFNQLIDLQHFHYLVPQPVCSSEIQALILVHSAPWNQEKRQIIRETWASIGRHTIDTPLRVLFLLGAVEDDRLQKDLLEENNQFADIIQGSFADDYRNMTYKHVMAFKWFLYNCPEAQILIKVDDDVYVNTPQLLKYLKKEQRRPQPQPEQQHQFKKSKDKNNENPTTIKTIKDTITTTAITKSTKSNSLFESLGIFTNSLTQELESSPTPPSPSSSASSSSSSSTTTNNAQPFIASEELLHRPQNLLFCQKIIGSLVKRSYRSKWRVGFKEYAARYYPPYCPGYAIIYSPDVIFRLYTAAQESKYFWIDDVHITGVLAQQTNTTITTSSHYVLYSDECDRLLTGKTDLNNVEFLFAWHSITARKIRALWHLQMMSQRSEEDLLQQQETDNSSAFASSSSSSSLSTPNAAAKRQESKDNRISYNISNYITSAEGFR